MVPVVVSPTTIRRFALGFAVLALAAASSVMRTRAQSTPASTTALPGLQGDGTTLLPNGWRLAPAGKHLQVGNCPLNIAVSPDGRFAVVTNNGLSKPSLSVIDIANWTVKSTFVLDHAWHGLAWSPDGTKVYSGGAAQNNVQEFAFADGVLTRARTFALPAQTGDTFAGGLAVSKDGRTLFATRVFALTLSTIDLATGQVTKTVQLAAEPYTCVISPDGKLLYVSLWGGARVDVYSADSLEQVDSFPTGDHPNALVLSPDGQRLFVACASGASIWVLDTFSGEAIEQVSTNLYSEQPPTATPNALGISPDGRTLVGADADLNALVVVDISNSARSFVNGFIPTGWYPTGVTFTRDGKQLLVLDGKGLVPAASVTTTMDRRLMGAVSLVPMPDRTTLLEYTRKVSTLTPYTDATRLSPPNIPIGSPIPGTVGMPSPIKHVFYIIRENRTYDSILGDLKSGNGDPTLTLFGNDVTPNAHALSQNFVTFDNFYVDADVSYNGHAYSTAAYATDFVEKMWQTTVAGRGGPYLGEGNGAMRTIFGNIAAPPLGYIWDYATRADVSVRSYGEFVRHASRSANGDVVAVGTVPGLAGIVAPSYAGWDLGIADAKRADNWLREFHAFEVSGGLPQLSIIRLPNDHTAGTVVGALTPRAMVADNDLALGRITEAISNSVYWKDSAIFVVEDDAQAGPDHVDSHRSVLLLASPFARRNVADHTFYTTSGVLRTIELILGLPPMSQYDASATPMVNAFLGTPNLTAYTKSDPRVSMDERNLSNAFGATLSGAMDFSVEDRAPEAQLNEILWRSVRGPTSPMPPPRRSIFVSPASRAVDADDDQP